MTPSVWLPGATTVTPCSRCYVCLGGPLSHRRWPRWGAVIRRAAQCVPEGAVLRVPCDDPTKQKAGTHSAGLDRSRNGAGSARQAYRPLRGLHWVLASLRMPLRRWPGHSRSVPGGLALSRKPAPAQKLHVPYRSRSPLARAILDGIAAQVPRRHLRSLADGGSAPKDSIRPWPTSVHVVGRLPLSAKLYQVPPTSMPKRRGAPRKTGDLIGSPKTLGPHAAGGAPHPTEAGAARHAWGGVWHSVVPGQLLRVGGRRREAKGAPKRSGQRNPPPAIAACFTPDLALSTDDLVSADGARWAVEMARREATAGDGRGQAQGRKRPHIMGANTCRLVRTGARTRWFIAHVEHSTGW